MWLSKTKKTRFPRENHAVTRKWGSTTRSHSAVPAQGFNRVTIGSFRLINRVVVLQAPPRVLMAWYRRSHSWDWQGERRRAQQHDSNNEESVEAEFSFSIPESRAFNGLVYVQCLACNYLRSDNLAGKRGTQGDAFVSAM